MAREKFLKFLPGWVRAFLRGGQEDSDPSPQGISPGTESSRPSFEENSFKPAEGFKANPEETPEARTQDPERSPHDAPVKAQENPKDPLENSEVTQPEALKPAETNAAEKEKPNPLLPESTRPQTKDAQPAKAVRVKYAKACSETQAKKALININRAGLIQSIGTGNTYRDCLKVVCDFVKDNKFGDLAHLTVKQADRFLKIKAQSVAQKKIDQYKQALEAHLRATGKLGLQEQLTRHLSGVETKLESRAYTRAQVNLIKQHQGEKHAFSTEIAYRCGLRAHELFTIERATEKSADKRYYSDGREKNLPSKFQDMGPGERYVVTGKGGLTREIFVPKDLADRLEKRRLASPVRVVDRGIFYDAKYDLAGGKRFSDSFTKASKRALGWSTGAHGLRHSYVQDRMKTLCKNTEYEVALETVSQEVGHFRPDITETYQR